LQGFFITARLDFISADFPSFDIGIIYADGHVEAGLDAQVYMDFNKNGDAAFGFTALAFAEALLMVGSRAVPPPCDEICLSASLELLIEMALEKHGGDWEFTGHGCGSMKFIATLCGLSEPFVGKVDITFSTEHDPIVSPELGVSCTNPKDGFDCN
jgi:hypothetical protein